jgi:predicted esterase
MVNLIADSNFATGPGIGASDLIRHVNGRLASCPNMKFVLVGYSQGAMVTGRSGWSDGRCSTLMLPTCHSVVTAENNSQLPRNSVVATILYGK